MDKFHLSEEMNYFTQIGLYRWRSCADNPDPHYCPVRRVRLWGIDMWSRGERPNTKPEVAIHEAGHIVAILALGQSFRVAVLGGSDGVLGVVRAPEKTNNSVVKAAGPLATSFKKYGNWKTWQQCWDDIEVIALCGRAGDDIPLAIRQAEQILQENWLVVEDIAARLLDKNKVTYRQCLSYFKGPTDKWHAFWNIFR